MTALSAPLPFTAALLAGLLTVPVLRDRATEPRARVLFAAFLATIGVLALLAGLRSGYGSAAAAARPVLAMTPAPLSYLAVRALTAAPDPAWWRDVARHAWPVLLAGALVATRAAPVDLAIIGSVLVYAGLLWRLRAGGPDAFVNAALGDAARVPRPLAAVVGLYLLSAVVDLAVLLDFELNAGAEVGPVLAAANLVLIAALGWGLIGRPRDHRAGAPPTVPAPSPDVGPEPPTPDDVAMLARLEELMATRHPYSDPDLTIARLARRLGVPARSVSRAVNRSLGLNVSQYINNHRVIEARRLLRETQGPVTEIMLAAGFQTKSNFNREFRRVTGTSPREWRQGGSGAG